MKRLLLTLILTALPFSVSMAQAVKPPVTFSIGQDLKTNNLLVVVGYDFSVTTVTSEDSTVTGQLVVGPTFLYGESGDTEYEGYGIAAAYDFPLVWKLRTELGGALYTLPAQGDNAEWAMIGGSLSFAPNSALRIKIGGDYIRKSGGDSGPWVYGNFSLRIAK